MIVNKKIFNKKQIKYIIKLKQPLSCSTKPRRLLKKYLFHFYKIYDIIKYTAEIRHYERAVYIMYSLTPSPNGYFMLPNDSVKYLKLAGAAQLKVLISVYKNMGAPVDIADISKTAGLSEGDCADALLFWIEKGLIVKSPSAEEKGINIQSIDNTKKNQTEVHAENKNTAPSVTDNETVPEKKKIPAIKPNTAQINERCKESPEIRELFLQAQSILGRTLGHDTQAQLLMCCDYLGLPVCVVLMICEYARQVNKTGISYIVKTAENWAEEGITTLESANKKITALEETSKVWTEFASRVGITNPSPSKSQSDYIYKWTFNYGYGIDIILLAYDEMADHITKFNMAYIDKTLTAWHEKKLNTVLDIKKYLADYKQQKTEQKQFNKKTAEKKQSQPVTENTSYDIGAAEKKASLGAPVYERKKKK